MLCIVLGTYAKRNQVSLIQCAFDFKNLKNNKNIISNVFGSWNKTSWSKVAI